MRAVRAAVVRLGAVFGAARRDRELSDELESHIELHVADGLRRGLTRGEARREALLMLGGVDQTKERYRDRRGVPLLDHLARELRFALRTLRRNPAFTAVAVVTLALGIGANTAIFSVVNAVLLRPLPFPHAPRLVLIWATNTKTGDTQDVASYPDFEDWRAQSRAFDAVVAFTTRGMALAGPEGAEPVTAVQATPGFFEALGAVPAHGRTFRSDEGETATSHVALLSDSAWKRRFGGRPDAIGQTIRVNEESYTLVGVTAPGFRFSPTEPEEIYVPLVRDPSRNHGFLRVVGRLRPGVRRRGPGRDGHHRAAHRGRVSENQPGGRGEPRPARVRPRGTRASRLADLPRRRRLDRVGTVPGVRSAALVADLPLAAVRIRWGS